jgi:hypothetical protein
MEKSTWLILSKMEKGFFTEQIPGFPFLLLNPFPISVHSWSWVYMPLKIQLLLRWSGLLNPLQKSR